MTKAYTWEQLAQTTLRRQFPNIRGRGPAAVTELIRRIGPVQSQVARSPYVSVAARLSGATYDDINAAHEAYDVVRGSNLRGTVHTCVREQHPLLDAVTRRASANSWRRGLRLDRVSVEECRAEMARFASGRWRTPAELREHLSQWLERVESAESVEASRTSGMGRSMAHGHSALIRRPMRGGWDRQTPPGYRLAADVLGAEPSPWLLDPDSAMVELTRLHLASYGPANRRDIAWWSGEGLRNVDAALTRLAGELTERPGPDGATYYDLVEAPSRGDRDAGLRLLPEFDAVVVGYDPKTRDRFFDAAHLGYFWVSSNGMFTSVLLADGRLTGSWRFVGSDDERQLHVRMFPGAPTVSESDLADQVEALQAALAMTVTEVQITTAD